MPWDKQRRAKKLRCRFHGPYKILQQLGPVSYRLHIPEESNIHDIFHVGLLKPATDFDPTVSGMREDMGCLPCPDEDREYEAEQVLAKRRMSGGTFY
eukprot:SAG11_NODE_12944_length_677_cov_2.711073_1_plen_96_part_10